jgi:2'-5' RNA ligase/preprotein translocase subunit YajC
MAVTAEQKKQLLDAAQSLQARGMAALAQAPAPLRRALSGTNVRFRSEGGPTSSIAAPQSRDANLAGVVANDPRTINVMDQGAFQKAPQQLAVHEGMHLWQNSLPPSVQASIPADNPNNPYQVPSTDAVAKLLKRGSNILALPKESQSATLQKYQADGGDQSAPQAERDTYGKLAQTMNAIPQSVIQGTDPDATELNTTPRAPLPPADALGAMQPATKIYPEKTPEKKKVDLSAGMVKKAAAHHAEDISKHPAGKVTAIDEESGLPIVRRHKPGETKPAAHETKAAEKKPEPSKNDTAVKNSPAKSEDAKPERATKYEFGSTQANIPAESEAHKAITETQKHIPKEHLAGKGLDVDKPHVTVRYGIQGDDTSGVKKYLAGQKPFEAKLGKTGVFPPSKNSDGAAVVHAEVHSPDLHRMNSEIAKHGKFKESDFPDYKPHVTVAYVKPEHADKYKNMAGAEGKSFKVTHVAVSDKNGNHEEVALGGKQDAAGAKPEDKQKKAGTGFGALNLTKGQTVHLNSGIRGSIQHVNTSMKIVRIKTHDGHNLTVRHSQIAAVEDGKNDRNRAAEQASTT